MNHLTQTTKLIRSIESLPVHSLIIKFNYRRLNFNWIMNNCWFWRWFKRGKATTDVAASSRVSGIADSSGWRLRPLSALAMIYSFLASAAECFGSHRKSFQSSKWSGKFLRGNLSCGIRKGEEKPRSDKILEVSSSASAFRWIKEEEEEKH